MVHAKKRKHNVCLSTHTYSFWLLDVICVFCYSTDTSLSVNSNYQRNCNEIKLANWIPACSYLNRTCSQSFTSSAHHGYMVRMGNDRQADRRTDRQNQSAYKEIIPIFCFFARGPHGWLDMDIVRLKTKQDNIQGNTFIRHSINHW